MRHRFPGRPFEFEVLTDPDLKTVSDAIGYETTAATAVAIVGAVAWLLLVGQTLVRRSADEHSDSPTFIALGMTRQQLVAAAVIRAIPVGVGSALIAGLMALVGSLKTPIGLAAMAEIGDGFWLDATVVSVGAIVISVVTVVGLCSAAVVGRAGARSASRRKTWRTMPLRSVSAAIGLRLASPRQRRRLPVRLASIVAALAVACAIRGAGPCRIAPPSRRPWQGVRRHLRCGCNRQERPVLVRRQRRPGHESGSRTSVKSRLQQA